MTASSDLFGQARKLREDAVAIMSNPEVTHDEWVNAEQMAVDAAELDERGTKMAELETKIKAGAPAPGIPPAGGPAGQFKTWGHFLQAVHGSMVKRQDDPRLKLWYDEADPATRKDLGESTGAAGGYLVPTDFLPNIYSVMAETSIVRSRATVIPMRRRMVSIPVVDQTQTTAGYPHWFGGMHFDWAEEATQKNQSDPAFRQLVLEAHKLIGYTVSSDELLDDAAVSLEAFLAGPLGFAGGAQWMEDYAFLRGVGGGMPLGVINAPATISVARENGQFAIGFTDLVNMVEHFMQTGRGLWVFNQGAISNLMTMQDPNSNYLWPTLFAGGAAAGMPSTLLGYPYVFTEKAPVIGSAGDAGLYDFSYYLIGDRQGTTVESTKFDKWRYDQTSWRMVHRVDGKPWLSAPLTLADGAATVSPFVILGAKAT